MGDTTRARRRWINVRVAVAALPLVALATGSAALLSPGIAAAKAPSNVFTFKGSSAGTLKLSPSSTDCSYGKTANGKSHLVILTHLKGTITGAGSGLWAFTAYVPKQGATHVANANVHSLTDATFQNSGATITAFDETSGTITDKGKTGSLNLKVEFHPLVGDTYSGSDTVTGSWNCPQALSLG